MEPSFSPSTRREYTTKLLLTLLFLGLFILFITLYPGWQAFKITPLEMALLGLATFRLAHLVSYDLVMEPVRQFFARTVPDSTGAGESVEPRGEGIRRAFGQLICCPICSGTWIAAFLTYALILFPGPTQVFLVMTAAIGVAELLNALGEALSWLGQLARTQSGEKMKRGE